MIVLIFLYHLSLSALQHYYIILCLVIFNYSMLKKEKREKVKSVELREISEK